ncbi:MAG: DUF308 domain-containing protein [Ruthenibacterium sp.]
MKQIKSIQWVAVLAGLGITALGAFTVFKPQLLMNILPICIGIAMLCLGTTEIIAGIKGESINMLGTSGILQGAIGIAVGMVFLLKRGISIAFFGVVLGLWAIISGAFSLRKAIIFRSEPELFRCGCVDSALKIGVGILMLLHPFGSMTAWTMAIGAFFIFVGISVIVGVLFLGRLFKK